ncbi:MAG TPA: methyltransferase [Erysipelothrix sp.]|nr:methyltransferase [Erysipelothrix sp.]
MDFQLVSSDALFSKQRIDQGTLVLLEAIINLNPSGSLLDLGTGIGVVGVVLKKQFPLLEIIMSDVTQHAVEIATENIKTLGLDIPVLKSDGFAEIDQTFDWIILNPPIRAGKKVIYRLFEESLERLNPKGSLIIVMRKKHGLNSAIAFLEEKAVSIEKLMNKSNYHVLRIRK